MRGYIRTHIHQLFEAPKGLTVVYKGCKPHEMAEEQWLYRPKTIRLPVLAYVVLDIISMRPQTSGPAKEVARERVVEPLVYCGPEASSWLVNNGNNPVDTLGTVPMSVVSPGWRESGEPSDEDEHPRYHYCLGLYMKGVALDSAQGQGRASGRFMKKAEKYEKALKKMRGESPATT